MAADGESPLRAAATEGQQTTGPSENNARAQRGSPEADRTPSHPVAYYQSKVEELSPKNITLNLTQFSTYMVTLAPSSDTGNPFVWQEIQTLRYQIQALECPTISSTVEAMTP